MIYNMKNMEKELEYLERKNKVRPMSLMSRKGGLKPFIRIPLIQINFEFCPKCIPSSKMFYIAIIFHYKFLFYLCTLLLITFSLQCFF